MAARQIQRRLLSLLAASQPQFQTPARRFRESSWPFLSSTSSFLSRDDIHSRSLGTLAEASKQDGETGEELESCGVSANSAPSPINSNTMIKQMTSNLKISPRHDLLMFFTCKRCETRSMKSVCRESYYKGVVVARCDGCNNLHLIADRLGWFGEPSSVEDFLAARGEEVKKGSPETLGLTLEDLAGKNNLEKCLEKED
ncbi:PREDICTED: uncharacterized protein LOC109177349 [Ipomoea nil]|uniref:uncharacterized protein LOC109177349 n=1 Tax=Ipomoea nil TaxID=35883 RepID=UPI000901AFB8|nr:PREDICTED: uncharacterized protein LOC109177349 [Ipomoea nil]